MKDRPTPETDAEALSNQIQEESPLADTVSISFARKLERERDELYDQVDALRDSLLCLSNHIKKTLAAIN